MKIDAAFIEKWLFSHYLADLDWTRGEVKCLLSNKENWKYIEDLGEHYRNQRWGEDDELDVDDMGVDDALGFAMTGLIEGGHEGPHLDGCPYAPGGRYSKFSKKMASSRPEPWPEGACGEQEDDTFCINNAGHEDEHHFRSRGWIEMKLDGTSDEINESADKLTSQRRRRLAVSGLWRWEDSINMGILSNDTSEATAYVAGEEVAYVSEMNNGGWEWGVFGPRDSQGHKRILPQANGEAGTMEEAMREAEFAGIPFPDQAGFDFAAKKTANPYMPDGNPYSTPAPGTPDELLDGPPMPDPIQEQVPMTTRPRQMPAGSETETTEPTSITPEESVVLSSLGVLPLVCASTGRIFSAKVSEALRCVCGKRDYDIQTEGGYQITPTHIVVTTDDQEVPVERWEGTGGFISQDEELFYEDSPDVMEIRKIEKLGMEGDPPFTTIVNPELPMDELPANELFAKPFSDDDDFEAEVEEFLAKRGGKRAIETVIEDVQSGDRSTDYEFISEPSEGGPEETLVRVRYWDGQEDLKIFPAGQPIVVDREFFDIREGAVTSSWEVSRENISTYEGLSERLRVWTNLDGNIKYSVVEGPAILAYGGEGRYLWSASNLYGDVLAQGAETSPERAQEAAMTSLNAMVDQLALFGSKEKIAEIARDIVETNQIPFAEAVVLAKKVADRYYNDIYFIPSNTNTSVQFGVDNTATHITKLDPNTQWSYTTK